MIPEEISRARKVRIKNEQESKTLKRQNQARQAIETMKDWGNIELDDVDHFESLWRDIDAG